MTATGIREKVVAERAAWIEEMVEGIRALPLEDQEAFGQDSRNVAAAESYLRRALEALIDLGRHFLSKGFGQSVAEYKEVGRQLLRHGVLGQAEADLMAKLAGYRNRLVHFYDRVSPEELYEICSTRLGDIFSLLHALRKWLSQHPEVIDRSL